jgi:hypothetical protein
VTDFEQTDPPNFVAKSELLVVAMRGSHVESHVDFDQFRADLDRTVDQRLICDEDQ